MEMEIRHAVFDLLDPMRREPDDVTIHGSWRWHEEPAPYGSLTGAADVPASLRIDMHGYHPFGTQALAFDRRGRGHMGLRVTTADGTVFYYGDAALCPSDATGHYLLDAHRPLDETWRTIAVPFNDLRWATGSEPGCTLPNAPLGAIEILSSAGGLDIRSLRFLRPRSTRLAMRDNPRYCVAGLVLDHQPGQAVRLLGGDTVDLVQTVDQQGAFCFAGIESGVYELRSEAGGRSYRDRRGALVEVTGDLVTLELIPSA